MKKILVLSIAVFLLLSFKSIFTSKYVNVNADGSFKLFQIKHPDSPAVHGQVKVQQSLYQNLVNFSEEGFNNKFILSTSVLFVIDYRDMQTYKKK